jgi:hypothetical protein
MQKVIFPAGIGCFLLIAANAFAIAKPKATLHDARMAVHRSEKPSIGKVL